jgi:hypothetical protein
MCVVYLNCICITEYLYRSTQAGLISSYFLKVILVHLSFRCSIRILMRSLLKRQSFSSADSFQNVSISRLISSVTLLKNCESLS